MKRKVSNALAATLFAALAGAGVARAQTAANTTPASARPAPGAVDAERVIRTFAAKETLFRKALNEYSFKRDAVIQTIGMGGQITGEYRRVSRFVMDDKGNRFEKILFFPMPTMKEIEITPEDLEDLGGVQAFALETPQLDKYNISYVGKERIDELDLFIFDVAPKIMSNPKAAKEAIKAKQRFFQGRIWVDDQDFQIVKWRGKGVPEGKQRFPTFESYREQIDGRHWFPTYSWADDELVFDSGQVVRLRMQVKYTEFEKLRGTVRVIEEGEPGVEEPKANPAKPEPTPTPSAPKPKP
jgi:hypothetical protein